MGRKYTYPVALRAEDDVWLVEAPSLEGVHSYGRTVREALANIKEAIAAAEDIDDWSELDLKIAVGDKSLMSLLRTTETIRLLVDQASKAERSLLVKTVKTLHKDKSLSFRDTASILGLSHQRVAQLYSEAPRQSSVQYDESFRRFLSFMDDDGLGEIREIIEVFPVDEADREDATA